MYIQRWVSMINNSGVKNSFRWLSIGNNQLVIEHIVWLDRYRHTSNTLSLERGWEAQGPFQYEYALLTVYRFQLYDLTTVLSLKWEYPFLGRRHLDWSGPQHVSWYFVRSHRPLSAPTGSLSITCNQELMGDAEVISKVKISAGTVTTNMCVTYIKGGK